jgi:curved DNA-binding protein CbpA
MKSETRSLFNFFLSSFVNPMLRFWFPQRAKGPLRHGLPMWDTTWGNLLVYTLIIVGLIGSWFMQGIDHIFLGFLFLQAVPELQKRFWMRPMEHLYLVIGILAVCFPFFSIGLMAWYLPSYLEMLPKPYLLALCTVANARPSVPDHYLTLGVSPDADMKTIKKVFREESKELHPDKVGDDPVKLARFHAIQTAADALTKGRAEYDKSIENQELNEMVPRCYAFLVMMGYWLLHSLIDWNDVEQMRDSHKDMLRDHILADRPVDLKAIGLPDSEEGFETLKEYCEPTDIELPFLSNKKDDILEMRKLLEIAGIRLAPFPEVTGKVEKILQEVVLGSKDSKNLKDINTSPSCYNGYTLKVENTDNVNGETTIVDYKGGSDRIATVHPSLPFVPMPDQARFTLKKEGVQRDTSGLLGFHPFRHMNQIFVLGQGEGELKLHTAEGYYNGYTFEVKNGKTLVGRQRIYEYWPAQRKVVLEGPLLTAAGREDASLKPAPGSEYTIYPENLIPAPRKRFATESSASAPAITQVAASVSLPPAPRNECTAVFTRAAVMRAVLEKGGVFWPISLLPPNLTKKKYLFIIMSAGDGDTEEHRRGAQGICRGHAQCQE